MRILEKNLHLLHRWTRGYFAAKKYFQGPFVRQIDATLFDTTRKQTSFLYIFITTKNVLFFTTDFQTDENVLLEIELTDRFDVVHNAEQYLTEALNRQPGGERSLNISTTKPIDAIKMNDELLLFISIRADLKYGKTLVLNLKTLFFTGGNYNEQIAYLINWLRVPHMNPTADPTKLPGLKPSLSYLNIYGAVVSAILSQVLILGIIWFDAPNRFIAIIFEAMVIYSLFIWQKNLGRK